MRWPVFSRGDDHLVILPKGAVEEHRCCALQALCQSLAHPCAAGNVIDGALGAQELDTHGCLPDRADFHLRRFHIECGLPGHREDPDLQAGQGLQWSFERHGPSFHDTFCQDIEDTVVRRMPTLPSRRA